MDNKGRKIWTHMDALMHWEPLPDPDKPELPYRSGLRLSIRRHVPPPPFGRHYTSEGPARPEDDSHEKFHMKLSEWCLMRPPSSESPPHPDPAVRSLQVIDAVACKDGRGAQLVRCRVDADPARIYVAKIYDAFYYDYGGQYGLPTDVTRQADSDYSREAAAYETLREAEADGQLVPKYYGSWTFDLPVPEALRSSSSGPPSTTRPVRMILIEWVPGVSLDKIVEDEKAVKSIPPALRLEILAKAMEVFCAVEFLGVRQNDWAPRNVIVSPDSGWEARTPAVFMIDFNIADVIRSPYYKGPRWHITPALPTNPRYRFFNEWMPDFGMWIPKQYRESTTFNGWLATRWAPDEEGFHNPPPEDREYFDSDEHYKFVPLEPDSPYRDPMARRPPPGY